MAMLAMVQEGTIRTLHPWQCWQWFRRYHKKLTHMAMLAIKFRMYNKHLTPMAMVQEIS
jgi:hypothetical protein